MKDLTKFFVTPATSIFHTLELLNCNGSGICLVVKENQELLGVITDGDIRRALLQNVSIHMPISSHYTPKCFFVQEGYSRCDALDFMRAHKLTQIPVVDARHRVVGIHLLRELLLTEEKSNVAVIMAGGKGTRLGTITSQIPKPMLKVAGRPILERIILSLIGHGITHIYLAVNHLSEIIESYFGDGTSLGCRIEYLHEEMPLGSGGALCLLPPQSEPVLLMNGDLILDADFSRMLETHARENCYATMGVHQYLHEVPFGCIVEENNHIVALEEKPVLQKVINAGVYVLSPEAVASVPHNEFFPITRLFEAALAAQRKCGVYHLEGEWLDIGQPETLKRARGL